VRLKTELRHELKYLITHDQRRAILAGLADTMVPDQHSANASAYTIASLYYDTPTYRAYWDKVEGHRSRRKVRVRVYGDHTVTAETRCYVEIKQRQNQLMSKRRVALPYGSAIDPAAYPTIWSALGAGDEATLREVAYLHATLHLQPACVVTYQRLALNGLDPYTDLRVTFDTQLRGRIHDLSLLSPGTTAGQYFLAPHLCVMEVKVNHTVPYWLASLISQQRCSPRRISKYCLALEQSGAIAQRQRIVA